MKDYIIRATAANDSVRAFAISGTNMVEEARVMHETSPIVTAALGRMLMAGAMMGVTLKSEKDVMTLQIQGEGALKGITVTSYSDGFVKGFPNENIVILPPKNGKLDVGGAIYPGFLRVIKDMGLKEPYVGTVDLQTGEIAEDLTYYFAVSEQIPSSVGLGVLVNKDCTVNCAGGFIIQVMPNADDTVIDRLEKRLGEVDSVTKLLEQGMTPEDIIRYLMEGMDIDFLDTIPTQYHCNCSRERVSRAIASIGRKDLQEMVDAGEPVEVNCDFCGSHYLFDTEDLKQMLK